MIAADPQAEQKIRLFGEVEKLKAAKRILKCKSIYANATSGDIGPLEEYVAKNEERIVMEKGRCGLE